MCQEICDKVDKLHKEGGMPLKVSKAVEKILIKNMKLHEDNQNNIMINLNTCNKCNKNKIINKNSNNLNQLNNNCNCEQNDSKVDGNVMEENLINSNNSNNNDNVKISISKSDILAYGTHLTRILFHKIQQKYNEFLESNLYSSITKTTQPAHIISVGILLLVLYSIWPELIGHGNKQKNIFITVIYLLAVATHFGALIWMTFFSGLALYFSLPRHTFGQCQHVLFPMYFTLNAILSIVILISFIKIKSGDWNLMDRTQIFILGLRTITEVVVRLYFAPMLKSLMKVKYNFEKMQGSGKEVGYLDQKDLSKCPHYQNVNKRFRKIHAGAAIGNLTAFACSVLHILYLATKISIS